MRKSSVTQASISGTIRRVRLTMERVGEKVELRQRVRNVSIGSGEVVPRLYLVLAGLYLHYSLYSVQRRMSKIDKGRS